MNNWSDKRYWLIGASEGLGHALAKTMSENGVELIVSARSEGPLKTLCDSLPGKACYYTMDIQNGDEVKNVSREIGAVDGVVFLAGVYWPMDSQEWDSDKVEQMCDVNFLGAARVLGQVLPNMVKAGKGHVVLTGSLAGYRGLPSSIGYGASKAGIMHLAEGIYADLRKTNIKVQLINPGFIETRLTQKNKFKMPFIMSADKASKIFFQFMSAPKFKKDFPFMFSLFFRLGRFLPNKIYFTLFK